MIFKLTAKKICSILGICLLIISITNFIVWQSNIHNSQKENDDYVNTIRSIIPKPENVPLEERRNNTMSTLSIDDINFVGIIEMPRYGSSLPVCADWGDITSFPCRLSGSVYNSTLQIGATSQFGQYDFYREISVGDTVLFTDMEGNRYAFEVNDIKYSENAEQSVLQNDDSALCLFIKNIYSFEYLIVYCNTPK